MCGLTNQCGLCRIALHIPRYKIVLQSIIGEVKGQGTYVASRCLWDSETDNYASYAFRNVSAACVLFAVVIPN